MKNVLVFGAGKSATVLIRYLLANAAKEEWLVHVADVNLTLAQEKINGSPYGKAVSFDIINDEPIRQHLIKAADIVISLLPPLLHSIVANDCVKFSRNLLTASYIDDAMLALKNEIEDKQLLFLCEMGLDPGIDHMSAMELIDSIHAQNGKIISFQSHCGGLIAPESDNNPWHYKISWNPRNIVLAGKSGARYRKNGKDIDIPYSSVFENNPTIEIVPLSTLSYYPNRDSLPYINKYGLNGIDTFIRTTLRYPDFIKGWKKLIDLKFTDETLKYTTAGKKIADLFQEHLHAHGFAKFISGILHAADPFTKQFLYLGFSDHKTTMAPGIISAADLLQFVLEKKLALKPGDKDMIVMVHELEYELENKKLYLKSSLIVKGEDHLHTAMAKTVGLPLGIAAKLLLQGKINLKGLHIPIHKEIYAPVLRELKNNGIEFSTEVKRI